MSELPRFRPALDAIRAFEPARTTVSVMREFGVERILKLAGNENTLPTSPRVREAIARAATGLGEYPDVGWTLLLERLAATLGVAEERIVIDNGGFAVMTLLARAFLDPGDEVILPQPTFGWYGIAAQTAGARIVAVPLVDHTIDLDAVLGAVGAATRLVVLCNPNNPTGTIFGHAALARFLEALPSRVVVALDEAYVDFVDDPDFPRALDLLARHRNLVVLRTFSKLHGLAGLRIGYSIMDPEIAAGLHKVREPVAVNALAQAAALAALDDLDFQAETRERIFAGRRHWAEVLDGLGLPHVPSQTNFVFFDTTVDGDAIVRSYLERGILLRGGRGFGLPSFVRASIGGPEENRAVTDLLAGFVREARAGGGVPAD